MRDRNAERILRSLGLSCLIIAAAVCLPSGMPSAQAQTSDTAAEGSASLSNAEILTAFDGAAFGPADRPDPRLYRWPAGQSVTVRMIGSSPAAYRTWVTDHLETLSGLTGLDIRTTEAIGADVIIAFVPSFGDVLDGRYNDLLDRFVAAEDRRQDLLAGYRAVRAVCAGQVNARGSDMAEAIVFVPTDRMPPVAHACIAAQTSRILGLPFALAQGTPSTLATASPFAHLTALDRTMLLMLYHPRMRAGITRADAGTVARSILPEIIAPD
ncbi:MAG: DUF2927 domain-containing protein [Minwuia sp.]|nr:DUF2927 domain-containing protein [Minwuia sp.]